MSGVAVLLLGRFSFLPSPWRRGPGKVGLRYRMVRNP